MQQLNIFYILWDLRKLSCMKNHHENHFQWLLLFMVITCYLFPLLLLFLVILDKTLAGCIFYYFLFGSRFWQFYVDCETKCRLVFLLFSNKLVMTKQTFQDCISNQDSHRDARCHCQSVKSAERIFEKFHKSLSTIVAQ